MWKSVLFFTITQCICLSILVEAGHTTWVCGGLLAANVGSNPTSGIYVCLLRMLFFYKVEVSMSGRSPIQRSLTERGVSN